MKRTRIKSQSDKRAGERGQREEVRRIVVERDGPDCQLKGWSLCWHPAGEPLDLHEAPRRGQVPGAHLMPELCMLLCRLHHDIEDDHPVLAAELGIRISGNAWRMDPTEVDRARERRALARTGHLSETPEWALK